MTLESIFSNKKNGKEYIFSDSTHKSIYAKVKKPFFVSSQYANIKLCKSPKMIIFSAPGATGKSTLAKYLAYKYNGIYWNLADIQIGDNTFDGTLIKALGSKKISQFAGDLSNGDSTLIIDAVDEAEMISGRINVENFLLDINRFVENAKYPSVILFSRTETAHFMGAFLSENEIPFSHYEIRFFSETQGKKFIQERILLDNEKNISELSLTVKECIDEYFDKIKSSVNNDSEIIDFLGYAPVLQAMAKHINEFSNPIKLLNILTDKKTNKINLIKTIVEDLLEREQQKVKEAFVKKCSIIIPNYTSWEEVEVYSIKEQLVRLCSFVCDNSIKFNDYSINLPNGTISAYVECLEIFIPQHPFLYNSAKNDTMSDGFNFASPAFRDYVMANVLLDNDYYIYTEDYFYNNKGSKTNPSQLFWDYYLENSNDCIISSHMPYLYEAFKAKVNAGSTAYIGITSENDNVYGFFEINNKDHEEYSYTTEIKVEDKLIFNNLTNVAIDISKDVELGGFHNDIRIVNSSIICKNLILNADKVTIESYPPSPVLIAVTENIIKSNNKVIYIGGDKNLKISAKNINSYYQLIDYKYDFYNPSDIDDTIIVYNLRSIFQPFRTHKKDMPAKDAEYINNVILNTNKFRHKLFDFLLENNIVFRAEHLYKINIKAMSSMGISWQALRAVNEKQLSKFCEEFISWNKINNI